MIFYYFGYSATISLLLEVIAIGEVKKVSSTPEQAMKAQRGSVR